MWGFELFLLLSSALGPTGAAEGSRPRGVGPEFAKYFTSSDTFVCISNPSITLAASRVNDDYCDCPDGSDEPGTSACSYISDFSPSSPSIVDHPNVSLALPGFYCINKGHRPGYIPFLTVNDGVCDYDLCCDGSEEWAGVGGVKCENRCKEIGKEWRRKDEQKQRALGQAGRKRKELVADAARLRKEVEARIQTLQIEVESSAVKVKELEVALAETEKRERGKVIKGAGKSSRVAVLAGLAKDRVEELRTSLVDVRQQRNTAIDRVTELEAILTTFKEEYNPNFNDEGVKRAVRSWEEYAARDKPAMSHEAEDRDLDEIVKVDADSGSIRWSDWEEGDENDVDVLYKIEEYLPKPIRDWVDHKLRDLRTLLVENGILAPPHESGSESRKVTDARNALKAQEDSLENNRNQIRSHQEDLEKDYGPDGIFRALQGQCISKDSGEYVYEFCWLDRTKQKSKKGGGETGMGTFNRIDSVTVDEEVGSDGKGVGSGVRVALRYENGQHCWNGPNRSTLVVLACAEKDELWSVAEEEKCVYRMEVGTPAVCGVSGNGGSPGEVKDEL